MKSTNQFDRTSAYNAVVSSIDPTKSLPGQVFRKPWAKFLFFESDQIFVPSFVNAMTELVQIEGSTMACLLNFDRKGAMQGDHNASLFIDEKMNGAEYYSRLQDGGPSTAWLYDVERYGCASDLGQWCIYCEKTNDVAVIALERDIAAKLSVPLRKLHAEPIDSLLQRGLSERFPFNRLTSEWRSGLLASYGNR